MSSVTEFDFDDYDEPAFVECQGCDGHPACEDYGCAIKLGLGHLVQINDNNIGSI